MGLFPWIENFSVKKPIKEEFSLPPEKKTVAVTKASAKPKSGKAVPSSGTSSTQVVPSPIRYSYWKNMLEFFLKENITLLGFRDALAHLRQSAFGCSDWMFSPDSPNWFRCTSIALPTVESSIPPVVLAQMKLDKKRLILSSERWNYLDEPIEFVVQRKGRKHIAKMKRLDLIKDEICEYKKDSTC